MANVGDVFMFTVQGTINEQTWQNVHFYLLDDLSLSLQEGEFPDLIAEWVDWYVTNVFGILDSVTPPTMSWDLVKGENLFEVSEIGAVNFAAGTVGLIAGEVLAQFNSYAFTQPSGRRGMNPGSRRIPGVMEAGVGTYGALIEAYLTALNGVATSFSSEVLLTYRGGLGEANLKPIIVKRVREGAGTPEDPYTYRLPRNVGERTYYLANSWAARPVITTQNTRKTGRGI